MSLAMGAATLKTKIHWIDSFSDDAFNNVLVKCEDGHLISSSAIILGAVSPLLKNMLLNSSNETGQEVIMMCQISFHVFKDLLKLITSGEVCVGSKFRASEIIQLAQMLKCQIDFERNEIMEHGFEVKGEFVDSVVKLEEQEAFQTEDVDIDSCFDNENSDVTNNRQTKQRSVKGGKITEYNFKRNTKATVQTQNTDAEYKCDICKIDFEVMFDAHIHKKVHFGIDALKCTNGCDKILDTKALFHDHRQLHRKVICDICGKVMGNKHALKAHKAVMHEKSDVKAFKCNKCDKAFKTKALLKSHMFSHSTNRPYMCDVCGKGFKNKYKVGQHKQEVHERHLSKHACNQCDKKFFTRSKLEVHLRIHSGERHLSCEKCGKTFYDPKNLKSHFRLVHVGKTIATCKECETTFKTMKSFINHAVLHSDLKPFSCSNCLIGFKHTETVRRHIKKEHPEDKSAVVKCGISQEIKEILIQRYQLKPD